MAAAAIRSSADFKAADFKGDDPDPDAGSWDRAARTKFAALDRDDPQYAAARSLWALVRDVRELGLAPAERAARMDWIAGRYFPAAGAVHAGEIARTFHAWEGSAADVAALALSLFRDAEPRGASATAAAAGDPAAFRDLWFATVRLLSALDGDDASRVTARVAAAHAAAKAARLVLLPADD